MISMVSEAIRVTELGNMSKVSKAMGLPNGIDDHLGYVRLMGARKLNE
jgi:hypothetical protein